MKDKIIGFENIMNSKATNIGLYPLCRSIYCTPERNLILKITDSLKRFIRQKLKSPQRQKSRR